MTISSYSDNQSCEIRLTFGVPLEDVFPDGDIHPSLKNLFVEIYESLCTSKVSLENTLRHKNSTNYNNKILQEALTLHKPIDYMPLSTLIWTLRHFLGCLPLPLFPKYTNRRDFVWLKLADKCKHHIENYLNDQLHFKYLSELIAIELLKLPPVNLLLIGYLVNFFRSLIIRPTENERKTRSAALTLVNYFSSSLFIRPYNSNKSDKTSHHYHPLILYLLIKWPDIQITCIKKYPLCFVPIGKRNSDTRSHESYSIQTQTEFQLNIIQEEEYESSNIENTEQNSSTATVLTSVDNSLSTDSFLSASECSCDVYLKDIGIQTDSSLFREFKNISTQTEDTKQKHNKTENKCIKYIQEQLLKKSTSTQTSPKKSSPNISENSYVPFYDSDDFNIDDCIHKSSKTEEELVVRVSQIGWSYTNSPKEISEDESLKRNNIGWCTPSDKLRSGDKDSSRHSKLDDHRNNFESNESNDDKIYPKIDCDKIDIVTETKSVEKVMLHEDSSSDNKCKAEVDLVSTIPSCSNINNDFPLETNVQTPLNSSKSRKSLLSLGKIKSKMDFFKIFKERKLKGSTSEEQIGTSKVKYEKMTTVKSTFF